MTYLIHDQNYTTKWFCRACGKGPPDNSPVPYLLLGDQPMANDYKSKPFEEVKIYHLTAAVCKNCWHSQLTIVVDPKMMFDKYAYATGDNKTLLEYSEFFSSWLLEIYKSETAPRVLDIAGNDGTLLNCFKKHGCMTHLVDPAANLLEKSFRAGHFVKCDYWGTNVAQNMPKMDIITAQNVFAHVDDLVDFLEGCKIVMHDRTMLVIQTSQANQIINGEFDYWYFEHLSAFTTKSMKAIVERCGLVLERVEKTTIHGTSYVFFISLGGGVSCNDGGNNVYTHLMEEEMQGLYRFDTYEKFGWEANQLKEIFWNEMFKWRSKGYEIYGVGAAAKGMTMLQFTGNVSMKAILEDSPLKQHKFTPTGGIPIVPFDSCITESKPILFVFLAWNFKEQMMKKIKELRSNKIIPDKFLTYFPTVYVE